MKPVDMLIAKDPHRGIYGDCLRACVASIFDLPAGWVPDFAEPPHDLIDGQAPWVSRLRAWLQQQGFTVMIVTVDHAGQHWPAEFMAFHHIRYGARPEGGYHAGVFHGDQLVHDPLPGSNFPFLPDVYPQHYLIMVKA